MARPTDSADSWIKIADDFYAIPNLENDPICAAHASLMSRNCRHYSTADNIRDATLRIEALSRLSTWPQDLQRHMHEPARLLLCATHQGLARDIATRWSEVLLAEARKKHAETSAQGQLHGAGEWSRSRGSDREVRWIPADECRFWEALHQAVLDMAEQVDDFDRKWEREVEQEAERRRAQQQAERKSIEHEAAARRKPSSTSGRQHGRGMSKSGPPSHLQLPFRPIAERSDSAVASGSSLRLVSPGSGESRAPGEGDSGHASVE